MNLGISGKVAVVTASSSGLGKAVAEGLAAEGVQLVLFSRSEAALKAVANGITARYKVEVTPFTGDMRDENDVNRLAAHVKKHFRGPDILVLNSGRPPNPMREALNETENE